MAIKEFDRQMFCNALEAAEIYDHDEVIIPSYRGRGFAEEGFAVKVSNASTLYPLFVSLGFGAYEEDLYRDESDLESDVHRLAQSARTDSYGTGGLVYFPGWTLV
jgi:hypothetical protein